MILISVQIFLHSLKTTITNLCDTYQHNENHWSPNLGRKTYWKFCKEITFFNKTVFEISKPKKYLSFAQNITTIKWTTYSRTRIRLTFQRSFKSIVKAMKLFATSHKKITAQKSFPLRVPSAKHQTFPSLTYKKARILTALTCLAELQTMKLWNTISLD